MQILVRFILCLMISFSLVELPLMKAQAHAGMISTHKALDLMKRADSEKKVAEFMGRTDVTQQLIKLGIDPVDAQKRIAGLSDAEVKKLSSDIDQTIVGGDLGGVLILVLVILLIIYFAKRI